ncbi:MAG: ergothioneine biosynthesis protein EgtB [Burkholderiaceae bacterium]
MIPDPEFLPRFRSVRAASQGLVAGLSAEDCALQSMPDASPQKWHLAHTTWFWETFVLGVADPGYRPFDARYRYLFNSYYNAIGEQFPRPSRGLISRPSLETVLAYRRHVDEAMDRLAGGSVAWQGADAQRWAEVLALGLNHEEQHQELMLTDLKHLWSLNPLAPALEGSPPPNPPTRALRWLGFDGGPVDIGHDGRGFGFDNEFPRHRVWLAPFTIADRPVSNREYLAFIEAGGYEQPRWWLSEGHAHVLANGWRAPGCWRRVDGAWREYTLHGEVPLDPDAPVCHVSYYEADAYARFAGARLPTEFEWEHAAAGAVPAGQFAHADGRHPRMPLADEGLYGGVWNWTSSSYGAYPGFRASDDAIGEYNGKFMVNQYVLRGGSCATPPGHVRRSYRNFFPAWARWQFTGIRLAADQAP